VRIDSISVGHRWPSGAAQDRRAWLEVKAYNSRGELLFSHGDVLPGQDPEDLGDTGLLGLWDRTAKTDGTPAHFFWDVATVDPQTLRSPVTLDKNSSAFDHSTTVSYQAEGLANFANIDRITAKVHIRPLSHALLNDLVGSGDLAAGIATQLKTLDIVGADSEWTALTKGTGTALHTNCNPR